MLRTAHKIITGLIIALGLLHILFTFHDYDEFSLQALWFASAGIAMILAGFLNLVLLRDIGKDKIVRLLCVHTNFIFVMMFGAALFLLQFNGMQENLLFLVNLLYDIAVNLNFSTSVI